MRTIIIGAGHNGLTAAFYLAKAGMKPLVLEKTDTVGGGAVTTELHAGFRCPTLADHVTLRSDIAADMRLASHGVEFFAPPVDASALAADGPAAILYRDARRTSEALRAVGAKDGAAYPAYRAAIAALCRVLSSLSTSPAPHIDEPDVHDMWNLLRTARRFRALDRKNA
jgi:phytoene dehydrogenase-like protein